MSLQLLSSLSLHFFSPSWSPPANTGYTRFKPAVPITNVAIESDKMTNIPIFLCTLYSAFDTKQSISKVRRRYC